MEGPPPDERTLDAPPDATFPLRSLPFWTPGFTLVISAWVVGTTWAIAEPLAQAVREGRIGAALLMIAPPIVGAIAAIALRSRGHRRAAGAAIRLDAERAHFPVRDRPGVVLTVPYRAIEAIVVAGGPRAGQRLIVDAAQRAFAYDASRLAPATPGAVADALRAHIAAQPGGAEQLRSMDARASLIAIVARTPTVTTALMAAIAIAFAIQRLLPLGPLGDIHIGANLAAFVRAGQIDRLVTANFLHGGWLHILLNGFALLALGSAVERLLGPARFFVVYAISAVGGALASALVNRPMPSVGASTALYGLLGALGIIHLLHRKKVPVMLRGSARGWISIVLINLAITVAVPVIDVAAHAGGLVAGMLATWLVTMRTPPLAEPQRRTTVSGVVAVALAALFVVAIGTSAVRAAATPYDETLAAFSRSTIARGDQTAADLNEVAWYIAIDPRADRASLDVALELAEHAVRAKPEESEIADTLATVCHRRGDFDRAIEIERAIVGKREFYASQLARFLAARLDARGPMTLPPDSTTTATVALVRSPDRERPLVTLAVAGDAPNGLEFEAVLRASDGTVLGLVRGRTAAPRGSLTAELPADFPAATRLDLALLDLAARVDPGTPFTVTAIAMDDQAAALP